MTTLMPMEPTMAPPGPRASLKLPQDVVDSARNVASLKGVQIQDLLAEILRPVLAQMERELLEKRLHALDSRVPKPKPKGGK